jgi:hypothetical protein
MAVNAVKFVRVPLFHRNDGSVNQVWINPAWVQSVHVQEGETVVGLTDGMLKTPLSPDEFVDLLTGGGPKLQ